MLSPLDFLPTLDQWAQVLVGFGTALTGLAAAFGGAVIIFRFESNRRAEVRFKREQQRVSYRNLNITASDVLTRTATALTGPVQRDANGSLVPQTEDTQFLIYRLNVQNIGDGPVDVWACLVAARELSSGDHKESWGGNIEWNDLDPYYFDTDDDEQKHLAGISNTRHTVYSQDDYIQLDPKESDTLTRIDRIDKVTRDLTLVYRAFLVGRGYDPTDRNQPKRDVLVWQGLQQAMFNVSGPSFRILFHEDDPLDLVADRDGFQCFLLYHSAFVDDTRDEIGWTKIDHLNGKLEGTWGRDHSEADALAECERVLAPYREQWYRHWQTIKLAYAECKRLKAGFPELLSSGWRPSIPPLAQPIGQKKAKEIDLTQVTAQRAWELLPPYLRWDLEDDDELPIWEKFYVMSIKPGDGQAAAQ